MDGGGYDIVLLGQDDPTRIDMHALSARFAAEGYRQVGASLTEVGFTSPVSLFGTYAGQGSDLAGWLRDAIINTDRNLRLQYLAGIGLNQHTEASIFSEIVKLRRFPDALFVADDAWKAQLRDAISTAR